MSSKKLGAPASNQSSGSRDEGGGLERLELGKRKRSSRKKKHIWEQRFVIHPDDLRATLSELSKVQRSTGDCTTIPMDDGKSERELKESLVKKLPKLEGKRFTFFTKVTGRNCFCPCSSRGCEDTAHVENPTAEWNGKNIKKMARGNRVVYVLCLCKEAAVTERNGESNRTQAEYSTPQSSTSTSTQFFLPNRCARDEFLPGLATNSTLTDEEITSLVDTISIQDQRTRRIAKEKEDDSEEDDDDKNDDGDDDDNDDDDDDNDDEEEDEEDDDEVEIEKERQQQQMELDHENPVERSWGRGILTGRISNGTCHLENRVVTDSAYETLQTGSTATIYPVDSTHQSQLAVSSPLNTPTELAENRQNQAREQTAILIRIDDITPKEGSLEGGYNFYISSEVEHSFTGQLQVMFGDISPVSAVRINDSLLNGKVPASLTAGVVQVKLLNMSGQVISDTVPFTYTERKDKYNEERRRKRRNYLDGEITSSEDGLEYLSLVLEKIKEIDLNSKGGTSCNGEDKTRALSLLRMIVETAAKINAMKFFTIIFSTPVGRNVFKSFKDEDLLLEEVARENGHEELACFLEERHLMYKDDENDSDDEVDWGALAKAAKQYQRREAGREIIRSTSSESSHGYSGDLSVPSEHDQVNEGPFEELSEHQTTTSYAQYEEKAQTLLSEGSGTIFEHRYCHELDDCQPGLSENIPVVKIHFEESLEEQVTTSATQCQEEAQSLLSEESAFQSKCSLPDLAYSLIGRDAECEEVIGNLALNKWRVGVISGPPGIGKTSVAVEVGHKLLLKGWAVRYYACSDQDSSSEIAMMLKNHFQSTNLESDVVSDARNETIPVQETQRTLLILDQLENVLEADEPETIPRALQGFAEDAVDNVRCSKLLLVSRKGIDLNEDLAFCIKLEPLSSTFAVQLLQSVSQITSIADLEKIAKGCGCNPLAIAIIRALIQKGISENDIISMMSASDNFWKKLSHNVVRSYFLSQTKTLVNGQSTKLAQNESTEQKQTTIDSSIEEAQYNDEDETPCYEKTSDPRYCHCRLCMSSDGTDHLKSSAFLLSLSLDDLKNIIQDNEPLLKDRGEDLHIKDRNEGTDCHVLLLRGLKSLLHSSSVQHLFSHLKEAMKKAREFVSSVCGFRPLCRSNSCVNVDEGGIAQTSESKKEPTTNMDKIELVGQAQPCTCVSSPLQESTTRLNIDDIITVPSEFEELPSRGKKRTKLVAHETPLLKRRIFAILPAIIVVALLVGFTVYLFLEKAEDDAAPKVNSSTAIGSQGSEALPDVICKSRMAPDCLSNCSSNDIAVVNPATGKHSCFPCPPCHPGLGLSVPCGSIVRKRTSIKCIPCKFGVTFSNSFNSVCQNCSQCAPNGTVVTSCKPHSDVVCLRCQPNQITWISSKNEKYECFDCPICHSGFEPSPSCGSTVPHGVMITCVQCREGETFSNMKDKEQCKRCSSCPPGWKLIARCTTHFDTICRRISSTECGPNQIGVVINQTQIRCFGCPSCPVGMELSPPCGVVVDPQHLFTCIPCRPGSYSDEYSPNECKPCTVCPNGTVVISQCSKTTDTRCSTMCSPHQIMDEFTQTCFDCIKCSLGMEPFIPCGSVVPSLRRQKCTTCNPGTFSDSYGTDPCKPCHSCSKKMAVERNCTQLSDTVCLLCEANHYFDHQLSSCALCARCCNDGEDSYPRECSRLKSRKCKIRTCSPKSSVSLIEVPATRSTSTTPILLILPAITFVLTSLLFFLCTVFGFIFYVRFKSGQKKLRTKFKESRTRRWKDVADEFTLEDLDAEHIEMYDWICRKLDRSFRRDYERLAKMYDRISPEARRSLRNELKSPGGSPSRVLMSLLQSLYPHLTLSDFISTLKQIGRHDIAQRLIPLVLLRGNGKKTCSIQEDFV